MLMKGTMTYLVLAAGAACIALPASAASTRPQQQSPAAQATASQDFEASSHRRHWRRAHAHGVVVYPRRYRSSFAYYDPGFGYSRSYYARPAYVNVGSPFWGDPYYYDSYAYAPGPFVGHRWGPSLSVGFGGPGFGISFGGPHFGYW
jgi:Ni/Co efflux regulator RcnB